MEKKTNDGDFEKNRSMAAIRAQAKKELEREKQVSIGFSRGRPRIYD